ncbi:hypothetical protein P153DRAFT_368634 [Dothidotthia symphoricarpi CBS 119687]|uniref:Sensor histidine kinase-like protein/response regulator n=1 Tax=Dothidotthia symphoricarpi CBS 119687 TaxID=1392245 RepID=A0A6A6A660_9PLEO|nr:uncharacterized protein P153DRAFT_368634 [Dothidotthia symphoricarpi CBS 119687]KAF2127320.1 hypothetical protein P153DRAFT_368634 [Dothidotthia symphoricarpi CBS 119687]
MDHSDKSRHRHKPISKGRRERDVLQYCAAFRGIHCLDKLGPTFPPPEHVPRLSSDATLTALAQLTAIRLGAERAMISLIDDKWQYILAEAVPTISLRPETPGDASSMLWFGNTRISRTAGICERCLNIDLAAGDDVAVIVKDVALGDQQFFYAGAPLRSPSGAVVGTVCIFDDGTRDGLRQEDLGILQGLAATIIEYLHTYTVKDQYRRGEQLTRGLVSFAEGASALLPFEDLKRDDQEDWPADISSETEASTETGTKMGTNMTRSEKSTQDGRIHPPQLSPSAGTTKTVSKRNSSLVNLQENILPSNAKSMFVRAANVLVASSSLDGVMILDASVAAAGRRQRTNTTERRPESGVSGMESAEDSANSEISPGEESSSIRALDTQTPTSASKTCQILGYATSDGSDTLWPGVGPDPGRLLESDLSRLLQEFPDGKIFDFTAGGVYVSATDDSSSANSPGAGVDVERSGSDGQSKKKSPGSRRQRCSKAIEEMFPGVRSVAFVPFWDYERSRWFAGCLCWSRSEDRLLSASVDLPYFKIFSHSIMRELSRLDAMALNQAKTTFVASISHELRSPLHGILGTLEFIKDTQLDSFQTSMLNSLNACGQTLLDTINHVMDYAKISEAKRQVSSRRLMNSNTIRLSSKPLKGRRSKDAAFDLGIATEEVVEAVFSASSYVFVSSTQDLAASPRESSSDNGRTTFHDSTPKRKPTFIVLDIAYEEDWLYCFPVGSWKRIVMNIFGNAVKYTESGYIHVSLHASDPVKGTGSAKSVTLTVTDSGSGMSSPFLANKAFQPFSQENPHVSGTGLGLSIVRQILETNGGKVEISSDPAIGTKLTVKLALARPDVVQTCLHQRAEYLDWLPRLQGRRIYVLHKKLHVSSNEPDLAHPTEGFKRFTSTLVTTLANHLKMDVVQTTDWNERDAEIVVCPEPSFDYLATIRRNRRANQRAPMTIFVAMDALEAATLRSDVRITNRESVVEIMTQPCGPYKLAYILKRCLDRFEHPGENLPHISSPATFPQLDTFIGKEALHYMTVLSPPPIIKPSDAASSAAGSATLDHAISLPLPEKSGESQILVVDDNAINRKLLGAFMKKRKLEHVESENGLEALRTYRESTQRFDIILMDMSMPVMDGMTATRSIRQHEQDYNIDRCCIIALTGLASASAKLEAWSSGIDYFMTKPVNFKELDELLKREKRRQGKKALSKDEQISDADNEDEPTAYT